MFTLKQAGPERSDCTALYDVILDKEYTVKEFVDTVLTRDGELGYIYVMHTESKSIFENPRCEYKWGKLLHTLPEEVLDRKISDIAASGGWSSMDYILYLKRED